MNPCDIIRASAAAGIDLNIRDGQLFARLPDAPPAELLAAIREHKPAIIRALAAWPHIDGMADDYLERCRPLTPSDLTAAERAEAETLAVELQATGGLGWFVICVTGGWNDLTERDRLQAAWCWECAILGMADSIAA